MKLVNTLLDFSRIEAGRIEAVYERVDLCTLTRELAECVSFGNRESRIKLRSGL